MQSIFFYFTTEGTGSGFANFKFLVLNFEFIKTTNDEPVFIHRPLRSRRRGPGNTEIVYRVGFAHETCFSQQIRPI